MGVNNIYNDIIKGNYELAICELRIAKKEKSYLTPHCDLLISILENSKESGTKPKKKDIYTHLDIICGK